jgi:excisionase family DNA binding protein
MFAGMLNCVISLASGKQEDNMSGEPLLCSPEEAAQLLGVGRSQMFELIGRGEVESVKIGRLRKIPRDAIDTYVGRLRAEAADAAATG